MSIHDGHRERLRDQFLTHGLDSFTDYSALELLLFFALPRKDTNVLAHLLLERFGTLEEVFMASEQELCQVPGIGKSTAALILLVPQILKKSQISRADRIKRIMNIQQAAEYLIPRFQNETNELAFLVCLDGKRAVICCELLNRGVVGGVEINLRRIMELVLRCKASSVIFAHNHPDGELYPSTADDYLTKSLMDSLGRIGVSLFDHLIVSGDRYLSYAKTGRLRNYALL